MKILRFYIDTSVIGGCFDAEFSPWSNDLMQDFRRGHFRPVLSEVVAVEMRPAPEPGRVQYAELLSLGAELLAVNDEALDLSVLSFRIASKNPWKGLSEPPPCNVPISCGLIEVFEDGEGVRMPDI